MIYAPPSREKSKQTVRSPMIDKQNSSGAVGPNSNGMLSALSGGTANGDAMEYPMHNTQYGAMSVSGISTGMTSGAGAVTMGMSNRRKQQQIN